MGAINIVTRSGGNTFHGSGFYFYRDHNLAAYPGLQRDQTNPNRFFNEPSLAIKSAGQFVRTVPFSSLTTSATPSVEFLPSSHSRLILPLSEESFPVLFTASVEPDLFIIQTF
jgi:hypothetical protein